MFNFTSKHQARPAVGELVVGDRRWAIGGPGGPMRGACSTSAGAGGPHEITWNWGGGAGRAGDHVVGLQFGAKWTEGSGFTENGLIVDGRLSKIGRELRWDYDWDEPMRPWHIVDPGGQLDVVLTPRFDKHSHVDGGRVRQRDPPGVRHLVGAAADRRRPRASSSTASRASPRRPVNVW